MASLSSLPNLSNPKMIPSVDQTMEKKRKKRKLPTFNFAQQSKKKLPDMLSRSSKSMNKQVKVANESRKMPMGPYS